MSGGFPMPGSQSGSGLYGWLWSSAFPARRRSTTMSLKLWLELLQFSGWSWADALAASSSAQLRSAARLTAAGTPVVEAVQSTGVADFVPACVSVVDEVPEPSGAWSVVSDRLAVLVRVRSLLWVWVAASLTLSVFAAWVGSLLLVVVAVLSAALCGGVAVWLGVVTSSALRVLPLLLWSESVSVRRMVAALARLDQSLVPAHRSLCAGDGVSALSTVAVPAVREWAAAVSAGAGQAGRVGVLSSLDGVFSTVMWLVPVMLGSSAAVLSWVSLSAFSG